MKWSYAATGMIVLGIIGTFIIVLFQQITTNNESDYYLLKEVSEAAMIDSIDVSYYRETGNLKIVKEKFVENFLRRFANSTAYTGTGYTIEFYDLYEEPPKSSIIIKTGVTNYAVDADLRTGDNDIKVFNYLSGILEYVPTNKNDDFYDITETRRYYFIADRSSLQMDLIMNIPDDLNVPNVKDVRITGFGDTLAIESQAEVSRAYFDTQLYFENLSHKTFGDTYTLSYNLCKDTTGTVGKTSSGRADLDTRTISFDLTNIHGGGCVAVKFDVQWSYKKYRIN